MLVSHVKYRTSSICALLRAIAFALLLVAAHACSQTQDANVISEQPPTLSVVAVDGQPPPKNLVAVAAPPASVTVVPPAASVTVVPGRIVSVDQENKLVTLQATDGKQVILHVFNPSSLAAAKPGERFIARFYEIVSVQQQLLPGQYPSPQSLTAGMVDAVADQTPGAPYGSQYEFAVTIDAIDKNDKTISVKGLDGVVEEVVVANPQSLDQVHVGQEIVVTLIDVVGIALDQGGQLGVRSASDL
jgi:hypothetical protein